MSSGARRHFTSGLRRRTPRLEHGASTSTASQTAGNFGASVSAGPSSVSTIVTPSRFADSRTRFRRAGWGSKARMRPRFSRSWARWVVFVPGAAQTSPTVSPGTKTTHLRSEEHTSELQSPCNLVCRLLLEKKKKKTCTSVPTVAYGGATRFGDASPGGGLPESLTGNPGG